MAAAASLPSCCKPWDGCCGWEARVLRPNGVLELTLTLAALEVLSLWLAWLPLLAAWQTVWALQCATVLRLVSAVPSLPVALLLPAVASVWLLLVVLWGRRLVGWYGRQRSDG